MTLKQKREFESLPNPVERAKWLLNKGVSTKIDINPKTLNLVVRPVAAGVFLPGEYETEEEAKTMGELFLREKILGLEK